MHLNIFIYAEQFLIKSTMGRHLNRVCCSIIITLHCTGLSVVVDFPFIFDCRPKEIFPVLAIICLSVYLMLSIAHVKRTSTKGMKSVKSNQTSISLMYAVTGSPATTEMNMLVSTNMTVKLTAIADSK